MSLTKVTTNGLTDESITSTEIADGGLANADFAPGTLTNAKLAGSIANAKLANESITINSSATALRIVDESNKLTKLIDKSVEEINAKIDENQKNQKQELLNFKENFEYKLKKQTSLITGNLIFIITLLIGLGFYIFYRLN